MSDKNAKIKKVEVLLIEDNPDDVFTIQEMLTRENGREYKFKLLHAGRVEKALEILSRCKVDVILLDLFLPDGSGVDVLNRIYHASVNAPIVVLTSNGSAEDTADYIAKGAQDYLAKGQFNVELLSRTLLHAIERQKIHKEYLTIAKELSLANSQLEKLVFSDPLTGVFNRRGIQESLSREVQRSSRNNRELLALILDLDNFKQINDTLGHAVGDIVLKDIAKTLLRGVRVTDYVSRIGGDEFLILMPDTRFVEGVRIAEKIRRVLSESPIPLTMGPIFRITGSFGLLRVSPDTLSIDELLAQMHLILMRSKRLGKNQVSYGKSREEAEKDYSEQVTNILQSLRSGQQFRVLRQPIYDLEKMKTIGYEFLSRFTGPGLEMPDDFFRVSLENNILTVVDAQCLRNCVAAGSALPFEMKQHVNLFPSTMIDVPVRNLIDIFRHSGNKLSYCVEISEQQIVGDPSYLVGPVRELKDAGIQIAIDDVGFGRSSLESLILLEPDVVKIDKKWVTNITDNPGVARSLKRLRKIAGALGTDLVAEGIEAEADMKTLIEVGVKYGQGYYLGRPA